MSTPEERDDAEGSQTENAYEQPGGNYPDQGGADEAAVDEALAEPSTEKEPTEEPVAPEPDADDVSHQAVGIGVIDEPALDQNVASDDDKIAGIVQQTRHDVGDADTSRIEEVLAQRFHDAGLEVGAERLSALAREVAEG